MVKKKQSEIKKGERKLFPHFVLADELSVI